MKYALILILGCLSLISSKRDIDQARIDQINLLQNPGAENGKAKLALTTPANVVIQTSEPGRGKASFRWTPTAASEQFQMIARSPSKDMNGGSCLASFKYLWTGGTLGQINFKVTQTSPLEDVTTSIDLAPTSGTEWSEAQVAFRCPTDTKIPSITLTSTAAASAIDIDTGWLGTDYRLGKINLDYEYLGELTTTGTWTGATTYSSRYWRDQDHLVANVRVDLTGTPTPAVALQLDLPTGYTIDESKLPDPATTLFYEVGQVVLRDNSSGSRIGRASSRADGNNRVDVFFMNTGVGNVVTNSNITPTSPVNPLVSGDYLTVTYRVPVEEFSDTFESTTVTLETQGWHVDATIGGVNVAIPDGDAFAPSKLTNGGLSLVPASGSALVGISCDTTEENDPGDLTCSSNESVGVVFDAPYGGLYKACFQFSTSINTTATTVYSLSYLIAKRQNNDITVLQQEGEFREHLRQRSPSATATNIGHSSNHCGLFQLTSGKNTIGLYYEQDDIGSGASSNIVADRLSTQGERNINVTVFPLTQNFPQAVALNEAENNGPGFIKSYDEGSLSLTWEAFTNVDSVSATSAQYVKIGKQVNVYAIISVDATATSVPTTVRFPSSELPYTPNDDRYLGGSTTRISQISDTGGVVESGAHVFAGLTNITSSLARDWVVNFSYVTNE